ncbi:MAG: TonB family protein [Candidatus Sumerlaeia bacterium]|nr:TonB family protein [Candidatus Sumerlaeia bacterium]
MKKSKPATLGSVLRLILQSVLTIAGGFALTVISFLLLPLIQTLGEQQDTDLLVQTIDTAQLEPPPPPAEEEPEEEEPEEEPEPPQLSEEAPPLDLSALELALNPGTGGGAGAGDFVVELKTVATTGSKDSDALFSIADLDQKPRPIYQPGPTITDPMRKRAPGQVYIIFIVNQEGRVTDPIVQSSTDPIFDKAAIDAIKNWKFEPGKRAGKPVRFRMRVPITFPAGL